MANITGTELDDPNLTGTAEGDTISGLGGRDHLYGGAGNDTLFGGAGNDAMRGDAGADTMFGEAGDDDYYVDDVNDIVSETTTQGVDEGGKDRVYSTVSYTLSPFLERLVLLESAVALSATGNAQVNSIVGNSNANIISGGGGKDTLTGGLAADTFMFGRANAANTVTITDFAAEDKFGITASDYGLSQGNGLVDNGSGKLVLDPAWFAAVTGNQGTVAGHGQFLYNTTTRSVMWDPDGSGAATGIALATLQTGAVVSASNFEISGATGNPVVGDISIDDVTIAEGNSGTKTATFTVSRTGTAAFAVDFATANATAVAGSDYLATAGTLSFADGQATRTVSVTINGDTSVEPNETFFFNLANATNGGSIVDGQGLATITNDDATAVVGDISIDDVTIAEGNSGTKTATFTVSRTGTAAFAVDFATANGTAAAGSDYLATGATLNFAAGQATRTVSVTINGDTSVESNETFFLNLTNATNGGSIVDGQGVATITNDDATAVVGDISIDDVTIAEGNSGTKTATFTVSRTGTAAFAVDFATANATAVAGSDYLATAGTLSFADGHATRTVLVTINGDTSVEPNETFFFNLTNATNGGSIVDGQGLATISNDDSGGTGPAVVKSTDTAAFGSTDPAGIAYVPGMGFFVSDSEVEESPFFRTQDLWKLQPDGTLVQSFSVLNFTNEPTGLAFDSSNGRLYISDDDQRKIVWVDPANPTVKLGQSADTRLVNIVDPEDVAVNPTNGHLFIANGTGNSSNGGPFGAAIVETNDAVTQVYSVIRLPAEIKDPEALAYDASHDVFYVGGGFSPNIWVVDRSGNILQKLDVLEGFRNTNTSAHVKDLELAQSSDPNDDPAKLNLFVADYGNSHISDGRMIEIDLQGSLLLV
ncbi:Calx-beta domain-containing protein [Bradyrhizobium sp. sBnM-33]|uniref:Calx-beta domain-containing protein n=1 Tax=Bradyrhizobium sp. sBnM-33 TaxID=2831780 RepID=UPI001BD08CC4|nr:Calx-beta domain-containing protein [Bradyrhizobium sp. sBnM-33]WOH48295.1 Calx-beta domain-containing protein [Bradyrhizobium sp. sBnM-33]